MVTDTRQQRTKYYKLLDRFHSLIYSSFLPSNSSLVSFFSLLNLSHLLLMNSLLCVLSSLTLFLSLCFRYCQVSLFSPFYILLLSLLFSLNSLFQQFGVFMYVLSSCLTNCSFPRDFLFLFRIFLNILKPLCSLQFLLLWKLLLSLLIIFPINFNLTKCDISRLINLMKRPRNHGLSSSE
jgi:hypothetical protein